MQAARKKEHAVAKKRDNKIKRTKALAKNKAAANAKAAKFHTEIEKLAQQLSNAMEQVAVSHKLSILYANINHMEKEQLLDTAAKAQDQHGGKKSKGEGLVSIGVC